MRIATASVLVICMAILSESSAAAQEWTVDLCDVNLDLTALPQDHAGAKACQFTTDGKLLVTAGYEYEAANKTAMGEVNLRDARTGSLVARLLGGARYYAGSGRSGLAITRSGTLAAAIGRKDDPPSNFVDLFDLRGRRQIGRIALDNVMNISVAFSPDGSILAVGKHDGMLELWDPITGTLLRKQRVSRVGIGPIAFSPDGKLIATGHSDGSIATWNSASLAELGSIPAQLQLAEIGALAFSHDGRLIAAGGSMPGEKSLIQVWALSGAAPKTLSAELLGHRDHTYAVAFSPDDRLIATGSQDWTARIWDRVANRDLCTLNAHDESVYDVAFSPDGQLFATVGRDALKVWSVDKLRRGKTR